MEKTRKLEVATYSPNEWKARKGYVKVNGETVATDITKKEAAQRFTREAGFRFTEDRFEYWR